MPRTEPKIVANANGTGNKIKSSRMHALFRMGRSPRRTKTRQIISESVTNRADRQPSSRPVCASGKYRLGEENGRAALLAGAGEGEAALRIGLRRNRGMAHDAREDRCRR